MSDLRALVAGRPQVFADLSAAKRIEEAHNEACELVPFEQLATGRAWISFALDDGMVSKANGHVEVYASLDLALKWQRRTLTSRTAGFLKIQPTPTTTGEMHRWLEMCRRFHTDGLTPYSRAGALEWRQ